MTLGRETESLSTAAQKRNGGQGVPFSCCPAFSLWLVVPIGQTQQKAEGTELTGGQPPEAWSKGRVIGYRSGGQQGLCS